MWRIIAETADSFVGKGPERLISRLICTMPEADCNTTAIGNAESTRRELP
jgi:hypothetical protein